MERNREWTDAVRDALREAEATPPAEGWMRLERELGRIPAPRVPVWRVYRMRIAAAAAVVVCALTGGYLWNTTPDSVGFDGSQIASAAGGGKTATEQPAAPSVETVAESLGEPLMAVATNRAAARPVAQRNELLKRAVVVEPMGDSTSDSTSDSVSDAVESPQADKTTDVAENASADAGAHRTLRAGTRSRAVLSADEQARRLRGDDYVAVTAVRRRAKTSFSVHAGGVVTGKSASTGSIGMLMADASSVLPDDGFSMTPQNRYDYPESSFRHHQPLSFGVSVSKEFGYGLSLESGVNYTLLRSEVDLVHSTESVSQKLHLIGVPLRLNWQFLERGHFSLYIGAGAMVEKSVLAKFGTQSVAEPKVQWSVMGAVGAQYRLGGVVGLYFEPEVSHYFTKTDLRTSRTDSPLTLTLRLGVRLSF